MLIQNNIVCEYITFSVPSNFSNTDRYKFLQSAELSVKQVYICSNNGCKKSFQKASHLIRHAKVCEPCRHCNK